jgi:hypothetical protein
MDSEKGFSSFGSRVLSMEDLQKLPDDVRTKYEMIISEFIEMKALYETQKTSLGEF